MDVPADVERDRVLRWRDEGAFSDVGAVRAGAWLLHRDACRHRGIVGVGFRDSEAGAAD